MPSMDNEALFPDIFVSRVRMSKVTRHQDTFHEHRAEVAIRLKNQIFIIHPKTLDHHIHDSLCKTLQL